jgi:transcriptional regulator GlxA family with amidase domain
MRISIFLFDGVTALDAVGPYEALARLRETQIQFVGLTPGPKRTGDGFLGLIADAGVADVAGTDILIVPGGDGPGLAPLLANPELADWLRRLDQATTYTASVCSGAFILGAAGLLNGRTAATTWKAKGSLARFGAAYSPARYVFDGKYVTSAGVTAGVDMGLALCERIAGRDAAEAVELSIQYDPRPPFGTGAPQHATPERLKVMAERLRP